MRHKGQMARVDFDDRSNAFVGKLLGIGDVVSFHGETVQALREAFEEAVEDYIATCQAIGKPVEKPASGKLMLRVPPEVHGAALVAAQAAGTSLNQWAARVLQNAATA